MAITCSANCAEKLRVVPVSCGATIKKGGIARLIFVACNWVAPANETDYNDKDIWLAYIQSCQIRITSDIVGQKPAASFTETVYSSCKPAKVTGSTHTITFKDLNNDADKVMYEFYNKLLVEPEKYKLGWVDCDGDIYGFYPFGLQVSNVIGEQAQTSTNHFEGTFTVNSLPMLTPVKQPVFSDGTTLLELLTDNMTWNCIDEDPAAYGVPVETYEPEDFED